MDSKNKALKKLLNEQNYWASQLFQKCSVCSWESDELKEEIEKCPDCGELIDKHRTLRFGGLKIEYNPGKNRFRLKEKFSGEEVHIAESDFRETLVFMIRHFEFKY